jgi:hypothetical protein
MKKSALLTAFALLVLSAGAQTRYTPEEKAALDSMMKHDEFLNLLDSADKRVSYVDISIGVGNREFSAKNNSVNTSQASTTKLYYTPSVAYHHKSGFGIGVMPFLASDSGSFKVYQTAVIPSFDYTGDKISTGISFSRYFADNNSYNTNSIFQNDLYLYFKLPHGIIQPGIAVGYSTGKYKEINIFKYTPLFPPNSQPRLVHDSTDNKISDFTLSASIEHDFNFYNLLSKKDGISIIPQLMLSGGSEQLSITHLNKNYDLLNKRSGKLRNRTKNNSTAFGIQSAAFSLDLNYTTGKFFFEPNIYLDYFLPSTTEKRLTTVFSVTTGFSF